MTRIMLLIALALAVILWLLVRKGPPLASIAVRCLYRFARLAQSAAQGADYGLKAFRECRSETEIRLVSDASINFSGD